jgi:Flp pilus assembly protein TadG
MGMWQGFRSRQRGAVAVATAVSAVALLGFVGVVVDLGRTMVVKTELQNAADACALAAAFELDGNANALTRAENAGIAVATGNSVHFQSSAITATASDIKFSTVLSQGGDNSVYQTQAEGAPANSTYVMCTLWLQSMPMTLSSIIGMQAKSIAGRAVATVAPAQTSCAIPLGVCKKGGPPDYGYSPGTWIDGRQGAGNTGWTGNFNWIDFTPNGGGANELAELLGGQGMCNTQIGNPVGQTGMIQSLEKAWNSRFGIYKNGQGGFRPETSPPDFTGYAYTDPASGSALSGFLGKRVTNTPYQDQMNGYDDPMGSSELAQYGANRRLAIAPVVDCSGWPSSQQVPLEGYVCILILHPISDPHQTVYMEYVGPASDPASPCSTSGLAGGTIGPLVPVLVQ